MSELIPFQDVNGEERRCGSLILPPGMVSAYAPYESIVTPYTDAAIHRLITDPERVPSRVTFGTEWTQNQQSHGSCNGYLVAGLMAKMRWLTGTQDGMLFSGAFPYSKMNNGVDAGSYLEAGVDVACDCGDCPEALVPWDQIYPYQQPANADEVAALNKGFNPLRTTDFQQIRTALTQQIPVGVCIQFGYNFQRQNAKGIGGVDYGMGNHAVVADDLVVIDGEEYVDIHNSHGNGFGTFQNGRGYYPLSVFAQPLLYHYFYIFMNVV